MVRIYDAEFSGTEREHKHIAKFWHEDDVSGQCGTWNPGQAVSYVTRNPDTVYVREGTARIGVRANSNDQTEWIQTYADRIWRDNLTALAERHAEGKPNT